MERIDRKMLEGFELIKEGLARIYAPKLELYRRSDGVYEPSWAPVFYNPAMVMNRDINILLLYTLEYEGVKTRSIIDLLSATGIRGIRIGIETPGITDIILNDVSPLACRVMGVNIKINNLASSSTVSCRDARALSYELVKSGTHMDYVDIDPYGSPMPFIEPALSVPKINGVIGFTATDLAPLTGSHPWKTLKRYHAHMAKSDFSKELGLRILIYNILNKAFEHDIDYDILFSYYSDHYYRVYLRRTKSSKGIVEKINNGFGYILYCERCLNRRHVAFRDYFDSNTIKNYLVCGICGSPMRIVGPLWIRETARHNIVSKLHEITEKYEWIKSSRRIKKLSKLVIDEHSINVPYYYHLDHVSSTLKTNPPKIHRVIECLNSKGFNAQRTHMDPKGVKTDAPYQELRKCITECST